MTIPKSELRKITKKYIGKPLPEVEAIGSDATAVKPIVKQKKQVGKYKKIDSTKADIFRDVVFPMVGGPIASMMPSNIKQLAAKLTGDARMSNSSISDEQKVMLWDVIQQAMKRSGTSDGGTEYQDYETLGMGSGKQYDDWFNRGSFGLVEGAVSTATNPGFVLASTVGRGNYFTDPDDPKKIYYTDVYDWNPGEKYYKNNSAYKVIRNALRKNEDQHLNKEKNDNYRMNFEFNADEIEEMRKSMNQPYKKLTTPPVILPEHLEKVSNYISEGVKAIDDTLFPKQKNGGWLDKYQPGGNIAKTDATRVAAPLLKLTKAQLEKNKAINKQVMAKTEKANAKKLAARKKAIAESNESSILDPNDKRYSIGDKFRLFPNDVSGYGEAFDDFINPAVFVGNTASGLGNAMIDRDAGAFATEAGMALGAGALGFDPLGGAMKLSGNAGMSKFSGLGDYLTTQTPLANTYKINPFAFKPTEGMMYRGIGKAGMKDALESGVFRQAGFSSGVPKYNQVWYAEGPERFAKAQYFSKDVIAEVPKSSFTQASVDKFRGAPGMQIRGTNQHIPINEGRILQKDWLQGYKPINEDGGLLEKYNDGGPVQPNYNDYSVSAGPGFEGDGYSNVGRNYSPAWGGQFKNGGSLSMPTIKDKGSFNSDGIWIPDWKAMAAEAKKLGAKKVKTDRGGVIYFNDKWEAVSADDSNNMAMGGSIGGATQGIPGATGFMYARTGTTPSNGKYAKKTMASAQDGTSLSSVPVKEGEETTTSSSAAIPADKKRMRQQERIIDKVPDDIINQGRSEYRRNMLKNAIMQDMAKEQSIPLDQLDKNQVNKRTEELLAKREAQLANPDSEYVHGTGVSSGNSVGYWIKGRKSPLVSFSDTLNDAPIDVFENVANHEYAHAYYYGDDLLTNYEKDLIKQKVKETSDFYMSSPNYAASKNDPKNAAYFKNNEYIGSTEEIVARLKALHGTLKNNIIVNPKVDKSPTISTTSNSSTFFTPTSRDSLSGKGTWEEEPRYYNPSKDKVKPEYIQKLEEKDYFLKKLIRVLTPEKIAELMNTIAANNPQQGMPIAQDGIILNEGEETEPVKTPVVKSEERVKQEESFMDKAPKEIIQEGRSKFRYNMLEDAVRHDMALENFTSLEDVDKKELKKRTKELLEKREAKLANPTIEFVKGNGTRKTPVVGYYDPKNPNALISLSDNLDKYGIDEFANTVRHEFRHAYDEGGDYLTNYEKELIKNKTAVGDVDKIKALGRNMYNYFTHPTEVTARLQEIRGALKDNPRIVEYLRRDAFNADEFKDKYKVDKEGYYIDPNSKVRIPVYRHYDARRDKATQDDLYYLHQKKGSANTSGLIDLLRVMKTEDIVDLLNTIATNNPQQGVPMAQNGAEMKFYQEGLDFKPKTISKNGGWLSKYEEGGVIKDDMGQWAHPGEITEIGSNQITMQGVPYPVLGISDTGDMQMMYPNEEYEFIGDSVTEYPMMKQGGQLTKLDQLSNFTNYNTKQPGSWLDKYQ